MEASDPFGRNGLKEPLSELTKIIKSQVFTSNGLRGVAITSFFIHNNSVNYGTY